MVFRRGRDVIFALFIVVFVQVHFCIQLWQMMDRFDGYYMVVFGIVFTNLWHGYGVVRVGIYRVRVCFGSG
jgi:hypothetical protein